MSGVTEFMWGETFGRHIAHFPKQCHKSKFVIFQEKLWKVLKCYNFLWVQRWHNCCPAASFANCVMTLYLLKVHLQTFLSIPINQKCQILSCNTLVANERYHNSLFISCNGIFLRFCLLYIIVYWCWWHICSGAIYSEAIYVQRPYVFRGHICSEAIYVQEPYMFRRHICSAAINSVHMRQTFGNFNKIEHLYLLQFQNVGCMVYPPLAALCPTDKTLIKQRAQQEHP
jgi:hypothetical protein